MAASFNGRTPVLHTGDEGSTPSVATKREADEFEETLIPPGQRRSVSHPVIGAARSAKDCDEGGVRRGRTVQRFAHQPLKLEIRVRLPVRPPNG